MMGGTGRHKLVVERALVGQRSILKVITCVPTDEGRSLGGRKRQRGERNWILQHEQGGKLAE